MSLRLLTYNVGMLPIAGLGDNVGRAKLLAAEIARRDFDVVLFNEAFDGDARTAFWRGLGAAFEHQGGTPGLEAFPVEGETEAGSEEGVRILPIDPIDWPELGKSGLMLLTRHRTVRVREQPTFHEFSVAGDTDDFAAKGVGHVKLVVAGQVVHVFASHLQANADRRLYRRQQLREIADFIRTNVPKTVAQPWIFAGDLNVVGGSEEYEEMMSELLALEGHRPEDLWASLRPGEPGFTWDSDNSHVPDEEPSERLDFIIASGAGQLLARRIELQRYRVAGHVGKDLSDHFGLAAAFEIAGKPS